MLDVASQPTMPKRGDHHGRPCWYTRWRGDPDAAGKRPRYTYRWYGVTQREATALFASWLARWVNDPKMQNPQQTGPLTVADLCGVYRDYAAETYRKDGEITSHVYRINAALDRLAGAYGALPVEDLDMPRVASWRDAMTTGSLSRRYINDHLQVVRAMYAWAAEKGLVPQSVYLAINGVTRVKKGRTAATEREPVAPVAWQTIELTLPRLSDAAASLVKLLWWSGMRAEEACAMRGNELDQSGEVWLYRPVSHKTEHLTDRQKIIVLGPHAIEVVRDRMTTRLADELWPGWTTERLRRAIHRACDFVWPVPVELARLRLPAMGRKRFLYESVAAWRGRLGDRWRDVLAWQQTHRWNPHQLRHARATEVRRRYGEEGARLILGHRHVNTSELYGERDIREASQIAKSIG